MASDAAVIFVGVVGLGILVVGILLLVKQQPEPQQKQQTEVIVESPPLWNAWGGWGWPWMGPYYSRIPFRPVVY